MKHIYNLIKGLNNSNFTKEAGYITDLISSINKEQEDLITKSDSHDLLAKEVSKKINLTNPKVLGRGAFASAYLCYDKNNLSVVLKIIPKQELNNYLKLKKIREIAPKKIKKSLLKIYENGDTKDHNYAYIVTEYLEKLPETLGTILKGTYAYGDTYTEPLRFALKTKAFHISIQKALDEAFSWLKNRTISQDNKKESAMENIFTMENELKLIIAERIFSKLNIELKNESNDNYEHILSKCMNYAFMQDSKVKDIFSKIPSIFFEEFVEITILSLLTDVRRSAVKTNFTEIDNETNILKNIEPNKSFIEALEWLKEKGLKWRDLHEDNIMFRPNTGDIVISDFGLFE